jgi:hypothetical protein
MGKALQYFTPKADANLTPERRKFFHDNLILDIGLATGWVMAGNFRDLASFCANAKSEMAAMPADRHLFQAHADDEAK